ncbi:MAG: potassium-transporting ATPase subunit KdpB [Thermoplasmata archaeon]
MPVAGRGRVRVRYASALLGSFTRLHPVRMAHNPVMFVVYIFTIFTALVTLVPSVFPDITGAGFSRAYFLATTFVLFLTIWFSTLAESVAEAQGRAQAESLREMRTGTRACRVLPDGRNEHVPATALRRGDTVVVEEGEPVPLDGDVIEGAAEIDESMMTGESAAVMRESGGDRTSLLGGSRVTRGRVVVRISSNPGESFLDRMIQLVEGARREKSPNELALTLILAAFTSILLVVVLTFEFMVRPTGAVRVDIATLIALFVCLAPTTIGGLLPAIGIAAVNRVARANVIAKSGRAVEAAGDLDVLILDKTGTITIGNRIAIEFYPAADVPKEELLRASAIASSHDSTPEGRSILRLALRRGVPVDATRAEVKTVMAFTAQRRVSGLVLKDGTEVIKGAISAEMLEAGLTREVERAAREASAQGLTPLFVALGGKVLGIVVLKDVVKPGMRDRLRELKRMGIRTIMCTGDNAVTARAIARESGVDEFVAEAKPETKLELVEREKSFGRLVAMTGDGTNDAPALARADVGLAMNSGTSAAKEAGNMVDLDSDPTKIIEIVSLGKQLLITRGGLTTFSVTNDVAKYFAILPAIFVGITGVGLLNFLHLDDARLAVLATLLFNALIIPLMVPLALRGAPFRPRTAVDLLRSNILIYGVGGLLSAFAGIWLIYLGLQYLLLDPNVQAIIRAISQGVGG